MNNHTSTDAPQSTGGGGKLDAKTLSDEKLVFFNLLKEMKSDGTLGYNFEKGTHFIIHEGRAELLDLATVQ